MATPYLVKLEAFEGPLDLLLHLVKTNEVDIYHLPVARITDQYLEYLDLFEEMNLDVAGEYLVMAATLMCLKSKLLLPVDEDEGEEEEESVGDLVRQLAEYQRYREVAEELRERVVLGRDVFRRRACDPDSGQENNPGFRPVGLADLFEGLRRVLTRAAARQPHQIDEEEYRVADVVRRLVGRLREQGRVEFISLFSVASPRGLIVATFIGLLELIRLRIVEAEQSLRGGPILLRLLAEDVDDTVLALVETYGSEVGRELLGERG